MKTILVTGAAGFIGFHLSRRLLAEGHQVIGVDNLNPYYDVALKEARKAQLDTHPAFQFYPLDLAQRAATQQLFQNHKFDQVVHLAAQAGVRYSLENPHAYVDSNLVGFVNILEGCRQSQINHFVFASSSSVYGVNQKIPFAVTDSVDHPVSLYAATKKANELIAHSYSHLYQIPTTGLRFFTVYGPWGRPDMAYWKFTQAILENQPINVFNQGQMKRDFTYIDDVVEGIIRVMAKIPDPQGPSHAPYKIYNIGNNKPVELLTMIEILETCLSKTAIKNMLPMQPGDVPITYADVDDLMQDVGFQPSTPLLAGLREFVNWYCDYFKWKLS
ncbi:NAD-dependent epimerase [Spirulina subsalsa FACHB-351]|uniref:NAD-dependent epimerase n=1 Tax=Spirulina subsalsa FACHB-351 TaxID=234711 RepID=A0ABT3L7U3_9CYAN|nr:NAD-dependent epimerase [Spirulina subsalsa]MCW6037582.1 NAD-dependent epimerase [Spirulina subsalsa FACHB-351]